MYRLLYSRELNKNLLSTSVYENIKPVSSLLFHPIVSPDPDSLGKELKKVCLLYNVWLLLLRQLYLHETLSFLDEN